ncbi:MAG: hypothetical protein K6E90_00345 [Lachnospiraceae bacterium]|nr:hypothetical protein [Lachnospiraceae bacterium]
MVRYKHGITEPVRFLIELYKPSMDVFWNTSCNSDVMFSFIDDPVHFDYDQFDEKWWPLFIFSDLGMCAMKYGKAKVRKAFSRLTGEEREKAAYYAELYSEKEEIDMSDIYHIPDHIRNPRL